jgi:hypothetical protein
MPSNEERAVPIKDFCPVTGLIMVPIIVKEGVDGLQGKACEDCCDG